MMSLSGSESVTVTDDSSTDVEPDSDKQTQTVTASSKRTKKTTSYTCSQGDVDEPQSAADIVGGLAPSPTKAKIRKVTNAARNYSAKNEASKPRSSADGKGSKAKRQIGTEKVGGTPAKMRRKRKAGDNYDEADEKPAKHSSQFDVEYNPAVKIEPLESTSGGPGPRGRQQSGCPVLRGHGRGRPRGSHSVGPTAVRQSDVEGATGQGKTETPKVVSETGNYSADKGEVSSRRGSSADKGSEQKTRSGADTLDSASADMSSCKRESADYYNCESNKQSAEQVSVDIRETGPEMSMPSDRGRSNDALQVISSMQPRGRAVGQLQRARRRHNSRYYTNVGNRMPPPEEHTQQPGRGRGRGRPRGFGGAGFTGVGRAEPYAARGAALARGVWQRGLPIRGRGGRGISGVYRQPYISVTGGSVENLHVLKPVSHATSEYQILSYFLIYYIRCCKRVCCADIFSARCVR